MKFLSGLFAGKAKGLSGSRAAAGADIAAKASFEVVDPVFDDMVRFYAKGGLVDERRAQRLAALKAWAPLLHYAAQLTERHLENMDLQIQAKGNRYNPDRTDFTIRIEDNVGRLKARCDFSTLGPKHEVLHGAGDNADPLGRSFHKREMTEARTCFRKWLALQLGTAFDASRQNPEAEINITVNGRKVHDITPESAVPALRLRA